MRKYKVFLIVILPFIFFTCKPKKESVRALINKGLDSVAVGNHKAAIRLYTAALTIDPWLQKGYFNRGLSYLEIKDYVKALTDFNQIESMLSKNGVIVTQNRNVLSNEKDGWEVPYTDVIYWRAVTKADMDSLVPAYREFEYLITNNYSETSNCYLWQGILLGRSGNTTMACEKFEQARKTAKIEAAVKEAIEMLHKHCPEWKETIQGLKF